MASRNVLIVDDDQNTLQSLDFILTAAGYDVLMAADGRTALAAITSALETKKPVQLLVTDIQMPVLSGLELIDEIHRLGIILPILVITAYRDTYLLNELKKRGCTECLDKPLDADMLMGCISQLFEPQTEAMNT